MEKEELTPIEALKNMETFVNEEMGIKTFNQSGWHLEGSKDYEIIKQALEESEELKVKNAQLKGENYSNRILMKEWEKIIEDLRKENEKLKKHYFESEQKQIKKQELYLRAIGLRQKLDLIPINKALDLIKQKRENARLDLENDVMFHEKELLAQIDTYTDCIITIETEMGRGKK